MPFVRSASPRYFAPATFHYLDAEGHLVASLFDCEFKRLKLSEQKKLQAELGLWTAEIQRRLQKRADEITEAAKKGEGIAEAEAAANPKEAAEDSVNRKLLQKVMVGWRAVQAPDGSDLPFSFDAIDQTEEEFAGFINACAKSFWHSTQPTEAAHLAAKN